MLPPDSRAVLLDHLRPNAGFTLDAAVATTFTLSLPAAVIPPLAFSAFGANAATGQDPISQLEAVRAAAAKIDIFCQAGGIAVPARGADLFAFVEPMVHGVKRPPGGLFHPKLWFVRYRDSDGQAEYRLLVLTRNLTHDRAWDVVVRLDSVALSSVPHAMNAPLVRLLASLPGRAVTPLVSPRRERVEQLAEESRRVRWEHPNKVDSVGFHLLDEGVGLDLRGQRHLVISPFVNGAGIEQATAGSQDVTVISRAEELDRLPPETAEGISAFVLDEMAGVDAGESEGDTAGAGAPPAAMSLLTRLHAKVYVVEPDAQRQPRLLIGSANATDAALGSNVEFMVEFGGPRKSFGIDTFLGPEGSMAGFIKEYAVEGGESADAEEEELWALENALRSIAEIRHVMHVVKTQEAPTSGAFTLECSSERAYRSERTFAVTVALLTRPGAGQNVDPNVPLRATFEVLEKADITPFLCVTLTAASGVRASTVLLAELRNDPADRLDVVLARQIDTPEKFLRFLYLLLSLGNLHWLAELEGEGKGEANRHAGLRGPGILELVLHALAHNPSALDDLAGLVGRLTSTAEGRRLLPEGFEELWSAVVTARGDVKDPAR